MSVFDAIEACRTRVQSGIPQVRRKEKVEMYSHGLEAKIRQAQFALSRLSDLQNRSDRTEFSTAQDDLSIAGQVGFYCDAFWTFLYSAFDVLGQLVNQGMKLGMDEKDVSFKRVGTTLQSRHRGVPIQSDCDACKRSHAFKNLDRYRNCSTHRRQIYIQERTTVVSGTAGYPTSTAGDMSAVERVLCENPLDPAPRMTQGRQIPEYLEQTVVNLLSHIEQMLNDLQPVA